jgi:hypothetical protein
LRKSIDSTKILIYDGAGQKVLIWYFINDMGNIEKTLVSFKNWNIRETKINWSGANRTAQVDADLASLIRNSETSESASFRYEICYSSYLNLILEKRLIKRC